MDFSKFNSQTTSGILQYKHLKAREMSESVGGGALSSQWYETKNACPPATHGIHPYVDAAGKVYG